jgi:hypothetical protein
LKHGDYAKPFAVDEAMLSAPSSDEDRSTVDDDDLPPDSDDSAGGPAQDSEHSQELSSDSSVCLGPTRLLAPPDALVPLEPFAVDETILLAPSSDEDRSLVDDDDLPPVDDDEAMTPVPSSDEDMADVLGVWPPLFRAADMAAGSGLPFAFVQELSSYSEDSDTSSNYSSASTLAYDVEEQFGAEVHEADCAAGPCLRCLPDTATGPPPPQSPPGCNWADEAGSVGCAVIASDYKEIVHTS